MIDRRAKRGRPRRPPREKVTIYLRPEVLAEIRAECELVDCPLGWVIARAWRDAKLYREDGADVL